MVHCINPLCGIYWLDPAPTPEDLPVAYRGYYTHSQQDEILRPAGLRSNVRAAFLERRLGYPNRQGPTARLVSHLVALTPERKQSWLYGYFYLPWVVGGRLLEIGCGSGSQLARMKQAGWDTMGVDFDPQAADAARLRGLDVEVGDVRDLNLEGRSFDSVVMAHVLEHVFDPVSLLIECKRLLKPGGRLVSITPNGRSLGHRVYKRSWRGLEPPRHIAVFTPGGLRIACDHAGLAVERLDVTARDAANLLLASARTRVATTDLQIEKPQFGRQPPVALRAVAAVERLGNALGLGWGEELVLTARA
jgi:2-polyprenyl-3-methyl-5-hydroxy-6-metoxy-1,4-benzoquinol methylase